MDTKPRSEKHETARNSLPDDLKPIFDDLVEDYQNQNFQPIYESDLHGYLYHLFLKNRIISANRIQLNSRVKGAELIVIQNNTRYDTIFKEY